MKNRRLELRPPNGKFFCWHKWEANEWEVGPDWDITTGLNITARCTKCLRVSKVNTHQIKEVPDHLINKNIGYR